MYVTQLSDSAIDALLDDGPRPRGWHKSRSGNLTCRWAGTWQTIYKAGNGWRWCVNDDATGPRYSPAIYPTQDAAMAALGKHLRVVVRY